MLATIQGKQLRRIVGTLDEAKLLAAQWRTAQESELAFLPTRLKPDRLRAAEAFCFVLEKAGIPLDEGALFLLRNWKTSKKVAVSFALAEYEKARRLKGTSESQISNVLKAAKRFFADAVELGEPTRKEIETWLLAACPDEESSGNFNSLLGDLSAFLSWCVTREYLEKNGCIGIERRKRKNGLPTIVSAERVQALFSDLEANHPEWVPYFSICLFGMVRPGSREGEANRFDAALRDGRKVIHPDGLEIDGKAHGIRIVRWSECGPLQAWLKAYPPIDRLFPTERPTQAERVLKALREKYELTQDVLRHTGISAACYAGLSMAEIAIAAGTSESKIRKNYLGRWSREDTRRLYAIVPKRADSVAS